MTTQVADGADGSGTDVEDDVPGPGSRECWAHSG